MRRHLLLISDAEKTCGVEEFARQTARHLGEGGSTHVLGARGLDAALRAADDLVINLPVVAWKRKVIAPIVAAARARMMGRGVTLVLHEWADLATARRVSYLPLLPLATRILFSAPEVMTQFAMTPVSGMVTRRREVVPIPPNLVVPQWSRSTPQSEALAADRAAGTLVVAQFGSIYPKKDPLVPLDVIAELVRRGQDVRLVFIGSFIGDAVEAAFRERVAALDLGDRVMVTGYVRSSEELYGLFAEVDVFLYPLSEGLTSRRASVLAAASSGKPVVVSAPTRPDSLSHHRLFQQLVGQGTIQFAPLAAGAGMLADAVLAARSTPLQPLLAERAIDALWDDLVKQLAA